MIIGFLLLSIIWYTSYTLKRLRRYNVYIVSFFWWERQKNDARPYIFETRSSEWFDFKALLEASSNKFKMISRTKGHYSKAFLIFRGKLMKEKYWKLGTHAKKHLFAVLALSMSAGIMAQTFEPDHYTSYKVKTMGLFFP